LEEVRNQYIKYLGAMKPLDEVISVDQFSGEGILSEAKILEEVSMFMSFAISII